MQYTVGEAAKAAGKSKPMILRIIRWEQISATRDDAGAFRIDVAELHRVFHRAALKRIMTQPVIRRDAMIYASISRSPGRVLPKYKKRYGCRMT